MDGVEGGAGVLHPARGRAIDIGSAWADALGLGFRIGVLSTLTLGIYRFWGKTKLRRYFWSKIHVLGDPLEYTGRPRELFLGFLLALVFLGPIFIAYSMAQALLPPIQAMQFNTVLTVALVFLSGVATFSAYRYLLSRTVWRGIRCGLDGSAWRFGVYSFGWTLLSLLSLFTIHPIAHRATARYIVNRSRVGTQHFAMEPPLRTLMTVWLMAWGPVVLLLALLAVSYGQEFLFAMTELEQQVPVGTMSEESRLALAVLPSVGAVAFLGFSLFSLFYHFLRLKIYANALTRGQVGLVCDLPVRRTGFVMLGRYLGAALVAGIPFAIGLGVVVALGAALKMWGGLLLGLAVVVLWNGLWAGLLLSWIRAPMLQKVVSSLNITKAEELDRLGQGDNAISRTGEGMADLLDIDVAGI